MHSISLRSTLTVCLCFVAILHAHSQPVQQNRTFRIGDRNIQLSTTIYERQDSSVTFINLHQDEATSVKAAKAALQQVNRFAVTQMRADGIRFIRFKIGSSSFTLDPNRIFTAKGALATIIKNSKTKDPALCRSTAEQVLRLGNQIVEAFVKGKNLTVALHNNSNNGPLSILTYKNGTEAKNAAEVFVADGQDIDDFFLTTDRQVFEQLKMKGFNVVLQDNEKAEDDGSLSVYAGKHGIRYINIEAQDDHLQQQQRMVEAVLSILN